jgi:hypothetical protein
METGTINYLGIFFASFASHLIGAFWYSPLLFGKPWAKAMGYSDADIEMSKAELGPKYGMSFIGSFLLSFVMAYAHVFLKVSTVLEAIVISVFVFIGFVIPVLGNGVLFEGEPVKVFWINCGHYLTVLCAVGGILATWN